MQPVTTRVDDVVPALVALASATFGASVAVLDGPITIDQNQVLPPDVCVIGVSTDENSEAYGSQQDLTFGGLANRPLEVLTIHCELSTWSGDHAAGFAPLRTRARTLLGQFDMALRADTTLGHACDRVYLGPRLRWYALQSDDGPGMGVTFDVTTEAWL